MSIGRELSKDLLLRSAIAATSLLAGLAGKFVLDLVAVLTLTLWPSITKDLLLQALLLSLALLVPACLALLWYVMKLRGRKLAFGVHWNRRGDPLCPACDVSMSLDGIGDPNSDGLRCIKCNSHVWLVDGATQQTVSLRQAKEKLHAEGFIPPLPSHF